MFVKKFYFHLYFILKVGSYVVNINIRQGKIIGNRESTVFNNKIFYAFYRVPYAQAPIGKLRFKDPKPVKEWKDPLDATTEYRGACAQPHIVHNHRQYGFEDCLYLNIYTPNIFKLEKQNLNAVIVWIHGYVFSFSFSHIYGGDFLIDNDVVVITLTHRIGAFGFLKLNDSDTNSNMGLKDIVMGLKWIKKNIHSFGGDKDRITVMGSGSASTLISLLLTTKYKNLFSKLILHSGSIFSPSIFQGDYSNEKTRLEKEIKKAGVRNLISATTINIIRASQNIYSSKNVINLQRPVVPFSPIIEANTEKQLLRKDMYKDTNNLKVNNTPIMIGFTSQEGMSEAIPFIHNSNYIKLLQTSFKFMVPFEHGCKYDYSFKIYKEISKVIEKQYFKDGISENSMKDFLKLVSDLHIYPIYKFINTIINQGTKIYVYKFNYIGNFNVVKANSVAGSNIRVKGAAQGDELCYILKCDPLWESYVKIKENENDRDNIFIKMISRMWADFAKNKEVTPIHSYENVTWFPMSLTKDYVFHFGKHNKLVNSKKEQKMFEFWNRVYKKYYDPKHCQSQKDEL